MKINITQDHINRGISADCDACPMQIALMETGKFKSLKVFREFIIYKLIGDEVPTCVDNTKEVKDFIRTFDTEGKNFVSPGEFEFDINEEN